MKRDDLTGFAGGGNKGRKLEYLMAQAIDEGIEVMVASGSSQSNFIRQLACACRMFGISCIAAVMDLPFDAPAGKPAGDALASGGNRVLDDMFGLEMRVFPDDDWEVLWSHADAIVAEKSSAGRKVMLVPTGGSCPLGAYSFYMAGQELVSQTRIPFDHAVVPTSSGSTHAGLAYAFHGTATRVVGVSCDPEPLLVKELWHLTTGLDQLTGHDRLMVEEDFDLRLDFVGPGYGVASEEGGAAFEYLMEKEGILLDPVYSAKAFAGLLSLVRSGEIGGRVVFWHTGGLPTLFAR